MTKVIADDLNFCGVSRISNLPDPTDRHDAATKNYVDAAIAAIGVPAPTPTPTPTPAPAPAPAVPPSGLPLALSGVSGAALVAAMGPWTGTTPIALTASGLPAGVVFTDKGDATASLSGVFPVAGVYNFTITATNAAGSVQSIGNTITAMPAVVPPADLSTRFSDDFGDVGATAQILRNRPGWAAYNSTNSTNVTRDEFMAQNGAVICTKGDYDPAGIFVIGHDLGTPNGAVRVTFLNGGIVNGRDSRIVLAATDERNQISVGKEGTYLYIRKVVNGVQSDMAYLGGFAYNDGDTYDYLFPPGNILTVIKNGGTKWTFDVGAHVRGNIFGISTRREVAIDAFACNSLSGAVTINDHPSVFIPSEFVGDGLAPQRADFTGAVMAASGTWSGLKPTALQSRVTDVSGALMRDWEDIPGAVINADGTWSGNLRVPCGIDQYVSVRLRNDTSIWNVQATPVAVGPTILVYGQSNAGGSIQGGGDGTSTAPWTSNRLFYYDHNFTNKTSNTWMRNRGNVMSAPWLRMLSDMWNLPVGICGGAVAATAVEFLYPDAPPTSTLPDLYAPREPQVSAFELLRRNVSRAGATGKIALFEWNQGEGNGDAWSIQPGSDYNAKIGQVVTAIRNEFAGGRNVPAGIVMTGYMLDPVASTAPEVNYSMVRAEQKRLGLRLPNCFISHHTVGSQMNDAYHFSVVGQIENAVRSGMTFVNRIGGSGASPKGVGPQAGVPVRAGSVITIPIIANGATVIEARNGLTALAGQGGSPSPTADTAAANALTTWEVSADDFATTLPLASAKLTGTSVGAMAVELTLASAPAGPVKIRNFFGKKPAATSWPTGTYAQAIGGNRMIGMEPVAIPISVG